MAKQKQADKAYQDQVEPKKVEPRKKRSISGKGRQTRSVYEQMLDEIDPDVVEKELRELVIEIEATNTKLEKSRAVTHETLKLVVSL
jgi:hypothetical protein